MAMKANQFKYRDTYKIKQHVILITFFKKEIETSTHGIGYTISNLHIHKTYYSIIAKQEEERKKTRHEETIEITKIEDKKIIAFIK